MKNIRSVVFALPFCVCIFFLISMRDIASQGALHGLHLCRDVILPSIFPFMVVSRFFFSSGACASLGKVLQKPFSRGFGVGANGAGIILLGLVGGYPICASVAYDMYKKGIIGRSGASALIKYTNNASPSFIIGYIGSGILHDSGMGVLLYLCICASSLIYGAVFARVGEREYTAAQTRTSLSEYFVNSVTSSCTSVIFVCGFIVIFSVIASAVEILPAPISTLSVLLCELTVGIGGVCELAHFIPHTLLFGVICAAVSFSGICVMCQVSAASGGICKISEYIKAKSVQAVIAFALGVIFFPLIFN